LLQFQATILENLVVNFFKTWIISIKLYEEFLLIFLADLSCIFFIDEKVVSKKP